MFCETTLETANQNLHLNSVTLTTFVAKANRQR